MAEASGLSEVLRGSKEGNHANTAHIQLEKKKHREGKTSKKANWGDEVQDKKVREFPEAGKIGSFPKQSRYAIW